MNPGQQYCEKCNKIMNDVNFYTYKNGAKMNICKKCLTMHVNNFDTSTFFWILEKLDVPYIPEEWNKIIDKTYAKDPNKVNDGGAIIGKYLSKMRIKQFKDYTWADTERLQAELEEKKKLNKELTAQNEKMFTERFENGEISEAEYKTLMSTQTLHETQPIASTIIVDNPYDEKNFIDASLLPDFATELTDEDKIYLATKWGRTYKADEWVSLEQLYNEFMDSFDIQGAARIDTLKMICKTSLKMNQAIDTGDFETYQKLSRVYDAMMKSAKFTEAQNKEEKNGEFSSISELVLFCEKENGFIPRHNIDVPLDIADKDIQDMKAYTKSLIEEDTAVFKQIEQYIKKREILQEQEQSEKILKEQGEEFLELSDEDFKEYHNSIEEQRETDKESLEEEE